MLTEIGFGTLTDISGFVDGFGGVDGLDCHGPGCIGRFGGSKAADTAVFRGSGTIGSLGRSEAAGTSGAACTEGAAAVVSGVIDVVTNGASSQISEDFHE